MSTTIWRLRVPAAWTIFFVLLALVPTFGLASMAMPALACCTPESQELGAPVSTPLS